MNDVAFFDPSTKIGRLRSACYAKLEEHERDGALPTNGRFIFYELEQDGIIPKAYRHADGFSEPKPRPGNVPMHFLATIIMGIVLIAAGTMGRSPAATLDTVGCMNSWRRRWSTLPKANADPAAAGDQPGPLNAGSSYPLY